MKQGGEGIIYDLFKQQREIKGGLSRPDSRLLRNQYGIISTGYDRNLSSRLLSSARVIIRGRKGVSKRSFHTKKLGDLSLSLRSGLPPRLPLQLWQLTFLSGKGGILDHSKLKIGVNWRCWKFSKLEIITYYSIKHSIPRNLTHITFYSIYYCKFSKLFLLF